MSVEWAAGLLEGEGSFVLQSRRYPKIVCTMTDHDVIQRLSSVYPGGHVYEVSRQKEHHRDAWLWMLSGNLAREVMIELLPHMGERRSEQIQKVLAAHDAHLTQMQVKRDERQKMVESIARECLAGTSITELQRRHHLSHRTISGAMKSLAPAPRLERG